MRQVLDIYKEYKIMPSLQMHMLRVAAVASILCDNLTVPINKEEMVTACLLHDIGNIIKFDMTIFPDFFKPEGVAYWQAVKDEFIKKYGNDEHKASVEIVKELGCNERVIEIVDSIDFSNFYRNRDSENMSFKVATYADALVGPYGVVSYEERMEDSKKRYAAVNKGREVERARLVECGAEMGRQVFSHCKIKPEDITDEAVAPIIEELKNFVIK
ncbi:MAG: HD domain-containing protein [Patescibacteria group bacterium]